MLSSPELDAMRAVAAAALPDTVQIERLTRVSDGGGGSTETWTAQPDAVPCRIAPLGGGEGGQAGGRVSDQTTHVLTLPAGTEISEADRLLVAGVRYEVTAVRERGAWEISRRVEAREMTS